MRRNARYHPKMADSGITKRALAASFKELLDEQTFTQISIGEICAECGMNRKSFYYHFTDKHDLVLELGVGTGNLGDNVVDALVVGEGVLDVELHLYLLALGDHTSHTAVILDGEHNLANRLGVTHLI